MMKSKAVVALEGTEESKYSLPIPCCSLSCLPLILSLLMVAQYQRLAQAEDDKGNYRMEGRRCGTAEGLLSHSWGWAPEQLANDGQSPFRGEKGFFLSSLYFLDHSFLALLIRINCHYRESHENNVLFR